MPGEFPSTPELSPEQVDFADFIVGELELDPDCAIKAHGMTTNLHQGIALCTERLEQMPLSVIKSWVDVVIAANNTPG